MPYNRDAVEQAVDASNRAGRRIGGKERRMIRALLKGHARPVSTTDNKENDNGD